ncbi:hypothetical protein SAY86_022269 [Trapa natans]|uniref:Pentatricopeptide repeat-containing protein n=1 Tax=Trapa natans TaxID=22666 RepID=A0AAN7RFD3_TRANT|nr:hypothetical protein SAY86_022269 [Trapa natans]
MMSARTLSSGESSIEELSDSSKKICKLMSSNPAAILHTALDQGGIRASVEVVEDILKRFANAGMVAYRFFEWAGKQRNYSHSVRAYHSMIESLARIRQYQIMWDLVNAMRKEGILNIETFCIIMRKYARAQKVEEAVYAFNVMVKYDVHPNLAAFNSLLSALCKTRNVRKAQEIFDSMKEQFVPNSKTYSILIEGWGKAPNLPKARQIFQEMVDGGCKPDIVTYSIMVDVLCKAGRVDEAVGIIREMSPMFLEPTPFIYSILIHTYGVNNRIEDAVSTFLEMEKSGVPADVVVYNALISAFCKVNQLENAFRVLSEMNAKRVKPNSRTYNTILIALSSKGETEEAFKVFRGMIKVCDPDADTYTVMIKMFCEYNDLKMALNVWKYMKLKRFVPSMHTYTVLINGLCKKGNLEKACIFLEEMMENGNRPSSVTFGRIRQLLIKAGREDVLKFLREKMNLLVKDPLWD